MTEPVISERDGHTFRLTMSNPGKKNAISKAMYLGLADALKEAAQDDGIRVVHLCGADGVFTSGNIVDEFADTVLGDTPAVYQFLHTIAGFPKPIVAEVEGVAIGVGATMLLHCDLVYAAEGTRFGLPFVNLGLVPEAGSSYLLPRLAGQAKTAELIFLGGMFDAAEAERIGLVSKMVPKQALTEVVEKAVDRLCAQPPHALQRAKALLRAPLLGTLADRIDQELGLFATGLDEPEHLEALAAFKEKRAPIFT